MQSQDLPQVGDIYVKHRMLYDMYCLVIRISRGYIYYKQCDIDGNTALYSKEHNTTERKVAETIGEKVTILHRKKKQAEADAIQRSYKTAAICQKVIGIVSKPNLKITDAQLSELENIINSIANENTN